MLDHHHHHQHHKTIILNSRDDSIFADAITPKSLAITGQGAADNAFAQVAQHSRLALSPKLAEVANGRAMKLDPPDRHNVSASCAL